MNKERRKTLDEAASKLKNIGEMLGEINFNEMVELLNSAKTEVESVKEDEQEAFDNLSEGLQAAERGQRMEEVINSLDSIADAISTLSNTIEEAAWAEDINEIVGEIEGCLE